VRGPAKIVVFPGLRGERRIGRSLVLRCGLTGTQRSPDCLRTHLRWGERASGGARILVWKQPLQGVGDDPEERVKSSTLFPPSFPPSAAHPHRSLRSPSDFLVPPLLHLRRSHDSRAVFVRLVSSPTPSLVFGWLAFPNTGRSWHSPSSESVLLDRHGFIICFNDQFPG